MSETTYNSPVYHNAMGCMAEPHRVDDGQHLVLILDLDLAVRESLKFALEQNGLRVRTFSTTTSLLQDSGLPEAGCLVLGHRPPAVNCFHVIAGLKARGHILPVVIMTDHASQAFRRRAAKARVHHVIENPAFDGSLFDSIQDALRSPGRAVTG
ncbi:response regulator [Acidocella sp.]|uniref:response regulator n=1 Tax=Acidocella sp. TaxID=50710 RepID=UPI002F419D08